MILLQVIIISLLVFAIHYTMQSGEIFGFVSDWWSKKEDQLLDRYKDLRQMMREFEKCDQQMANKYRKQANTLRTKYNLISKLSQPLFSCPVCMAPWYGTGLYWLIPWSTIGLPAHNWVAWLVVIICCLGLNSIVVRTFKQDDE